VDDKQRVALPKRLRDVMGGAGVFVTPGTDGSLGIYTEASLAAWAERLAQASPTQHDVRAFGRLFYSQAEFVEIDGQGRIRIPAALAMLAALGHEAVLVGVNDHLELWDRGRWEAYVAAQSPQFDELAERAFRPPLNPEAG
jgi:MraZ protein